MNKKKDNDFLIFIFNKNYCSKFKEELFISFEIRLYSEKIQ